MRIAISGFGRIGRLLAYLYFKNPKYNECMDLVAINDLCPSETTKHLLLYDSTQFIGKRDLKVSYDENSMTINDKRILKFQERDPLKVDWKKLNVDMILECTGHFRDREKASFHLQSGAKKVLISAPGKNPDATFVYGVNNQDYNKEKHHIISNASCTTNCLAPIVKILNDNFGVEKALMTTIHSYTSDQRLLDNSHKDLRRARAAAINMVPTTTGAAKAVTEVIPELKGKLDGLAVRVPTPTVSIVDLTATLKKSVTKEMINNCILEASKGKMKNIIKLSTLPLVSSDYIGDSHSAIVDADLTTVMNDNDNTVKIMAWYDNEAGFSFRMMDLAAFIAKS